MIIDELIKCMNDEKAFIQKANERYRIFLNGKKDTKEEWENFMTCLLCSISEYEKKGKE